MLRWLRGLGASPTEVAQMQSKIAPDLWRHVVQAHDFLSALSPSEAEHLKHRAAWLLASKTINGARGAPLTDFMRLSIAAQASLPILNLSPVLYEGWEEIIVYPDSFAISRVEIDEAGVAHELHEEVSGEAWEGGPVVISWADTLSGDTADNVIIHEFAHKLDLYAGQANGVPDLSAHQELSTRTWKHILTTSFEQFSDALDTVEASIPRHIDPESDEASPWYQQLPLDPYAATDEAEFFAVSSEHFFVSPTSLSRTLPKWYSLLCTYYRQDPMQRIRSSHGDKVIGQ